MSEGHNTLDETIAIYRNHGLLFLMKKILKAVYYQLYYHRLRKILWSLISTVLHKFPSLIGFYRPLHRLLHILHPSRFTRADPLKTVWINPDRIKYVSNIHYTRPLGQIDTVSRKREFEKLPAYIGLEKYFRHNDPLDYKKFFERRTENSKNWGLAANQFEERLKDLEELHDNIKEEGYKTQKELFIQNRHNTVIKNNDAPHPLLNEIKADISGSGEFLWRTRGKHRLVIAKLLKIDKVPVLIGTRDPKWEKILRKSKKDKRTKDKYAKHPDIKQSISKERTI